ncbi:Transposase IS200 like [Nitrosomonas ureae]|uniref:Transposase IS200 like n=1 Tax=Nitrosomonas ureae TaxID=44577 RepID=A0A285BVD7_9PROT|nr:Transposase IS200 like [Nitrosomonas ureae]
MSGTRIRQKFAKERSLHEVNEHFSQIFNAIIVPRSNRAKVSKSITAREVFRLCSHVKKQLWGGEFWTDGYFVSTVGRHGDEDTIRDYVKKHGDVYQQLYEDRQLALF